MGEGGAERVGRLMPLADISRDSVLAAISECDRAGRRGFLAWHGYGPSTGYDLVYRGRKYPSKAIAGVAHGYEHGSHPLLSTEFSGGAEHTARALVHLGFAVHRDGKRLTTADVQLPQRFGTRPSADLRLYVVRPTNALSVAACHHHGFGTLLSPMTVVNDKPVDLSGHVRPLDGLPYMLDNGAWACHQAGIEWRPAPFLRMLDRLGGGIAGSTAPRFAVLPDIVGGGEQSLDRSLDFWAQRQRDGIEERVGQWLLAVQDGLTPEVIRPVLEQHRFGIFVGGSTPWKWGTVHEWAELAHDLGTSIHVGRVNSLRRAVLCRDLGVSSIDGSSVTVYSVNAPKMARAHDGDDEPHSLSGAASARQAIASRKFSLTLGLPP
jgi:hypothetical protein